MRVEGHTRDVNTLAFSHRLSVPSAGRRPDGAAVEVAGSVPTHGPCGEVTSVRFSPGRHTTASAADARQVVDATKMERATLTGHARCDVARHPPMSARPGVRCWDRTIRMGIAVRRTRHTCVGHDKMVTALTFAPNGLTLASGSWDKTARLWDAASGQELLAVMGHGFAVSSVVFALDGQTLFTGSWDTTIKRWDLATGRETQALTGHTESVRPLSLAGDGGAPASSSWDGTVRIWDIATGGRSPCRVRMKRSTPSRSRTPAS